MTTSNKVTFTNVICTVLSLCCAILSCGTLVYWETIKHDDNERLAKHMLFIHSRVLPTLLMEKDGSTKEVGHWTQYYLMNSGRDIEVKTAKIYLVDIVNGSEKIIDAPEDWYKSLSYTGDTAGEILTFGEIPTIVRVRYEIKKRLANQQNKPIPDHNICVRADITYSAYDGEIIEKSFLIPEGKATCSSAENKKAQAER